jgi:hypothetical protein
LCVAFAYTHGDGHGNGNGISNANDYANCNTWRQNYPHTATASHAAASAVRPGFNGIVFLRGLAFASPRNAYFAAEEDTRSAESLFSLAQIA